MRVLLIMLLFLVGCNKDSIDPDPADKVSDKNYYKFDLLLSHVLEVDWDLGKIALYTDTGDCIRPATLNDGIVLPEKVREHKGGSMIVETTGGNVYIVQQVEGGVHIEGIGFAETVLPWLITKC